MPVFPMYHMYHMYCMYHMYRVYRMYCMYHMYHVLHCPHRIVCTLLYNLIQRSASLTLQHLYATDKLAVKLPHRKWDNSTDIAITKNNKNCTIKSSINLTYFHQQHSILGARWRDLGEQ